MKKLGIALGRNFSFKFNSIKFPIAS